MRGHLARCSTGSKSSREHESKTCTCLKVDDWWARTVRPRHRIRGPCQPVIPTMLDTITALSLSLGIIPINLTSCRTTFVIHV